MEDAEGEAHFRLDVLGALGLDELAVQPGRARVRAGPGLVPIMLFDRGQELSYNGIGVGLVQVGVQGRVAVFVLVGRVRALRQEVWTSSGLSPWNAAA